MQVVNRYPWMLAAFATLQVSELHSSSTLLLSGDSKRLAGFMNQQYSMLLRQHRQWCLPTGLVRDQY